MKYLQKTAVSDVQIEFQKNVEPILIHQGFSKKSVEAISKWYKF